jgi:MFS family permease
MQNSWLSQPLDKEFTPSAVRSVQSKWQDHQRKFRISNLCMSFGFLATFIVTGWIYSEFRHEYQWPFELSIAAIYLILIIFLIVTWRSYGFKKERMEVSSVEYITYQLKKLHWQRKILTSYVWLYIVLLWLALSLYIIEITKRGTLLFTLTALGVTTGYIAGITLWNKFYKQKKQLQAIEDLSADLKQILTEINNH